ncbi:MAG: SHOCT domain-containing protein [Actinomycetota bacterium]
MHLAALDLVARGGDSGPYFLFPLLLLLLLGFLLARVVRWRRTGSWTPEQRHMHGTSPLRTLEDRFARGDIDRSEFEHRKAVLEGADVIPPAPANPTPPAPPAPPVTDALDDTVEADPTDETEE